MNMRPCPSGRIRPATSPATSPVAVAGQPFTPSQEAPMKLTIAFASALLLTTSLTARAGNDNGPANNCNGNGSCGTTNLTTITNAPVAHGGAGGQGGQGGKGGDASAAAIAGANSSSKAGAIAVGINANDNRSSSNQSQGQDQDQAQSVTYINPRNPVSTASAAALATSSEACMGSSSIGGQGVGFGLSFGTTWENEDCKRRKQAGLLFAIGATDAAKEVLCGDPEIRSAYLAAGKPCSADKPAPAPAVVQEPPQIEMNPVVPN